MSLNFDRLSSLGEALFDATVTYKTNVALIEADRKREAGRWTYQQLRSEAERFGALIQGGGFEAGQRCAILMSNQAR
jgi:acyl-CoA synthetase (AMP-forming)/AMP-acid ligase II